MKPTLEQIAQKIGVSKVTVFKALNNQKGVSDSVRQQIIDFAKSIGYETKSNTVRAKNMNFLFVIRKAFFFTPSEQFYSPIFLHLNAECTKLNCSLQLLFLEEDSSFGDLKNAVSLSSPDGIFFVGELGKTLLNNIADLNIPSVFIDYYTLQPPAACVFIDNYQLSYTLTQYLIHNGHKKIAFVGDIRSTSTIADRYYGYRKALNEATLHFISSWHVNHNLEKTKEVFGLDFMDNDVTAIICHCDACAQKVYNELMLKGLKIPQDISVVSFDDTPLCESLFPTLTSVGVKKEIFAQKALNAMLETINSGKYSLVQIRPSLSERNSVKNILQPNE